MDVSENSGTPKSSILIGFSSIIHFGVPLFLETPIFSTQLRPGPNSTTTKKIHTHHTRTVRPMGCRLKLVQHIFGFSQFGHFSLWWESWGGSGAPPIRKNMAIQMILFFHCHVGLREGIFPKPELFGHFGGDSLILKPPFGVTDRRFGCYYVPGKSYMYTRIELHICIYKVGPYQLWMEV